LRYDPDRQIPQYKGMDTYLVLKVVSKLAVEKEELSFMCDPEKL
jgi:hypothetical protein